MIPFDQGKYSKVEVLEKWRVFGVAVYGSKTPNPKVVYLKPLSLRQILSRIRLRLFSTGYIGLSYDTYNPLTGGYL